MCNGFRIGQAQSASKFHFMKVSGVVASTCKHVLFHAGSVVDMQRDEM